MVFSREAGPLKIATFNINNINKRLHNLTAWLARAQPDVVCLQELKVEQRAFPASALRDLGYRGVWLGERSWNGVAILTRERDPLLTRSSLPGNPKDRQARYIEAAVNGVLIASIYLPNGNPQPGPKFDYKMAWFECLIEHGAELMKAGVPVVLAGDYNVVPTVQDIYPTRSLDNNALIQPQSRQAYARLLAQGWTDALRKLQPEGPLWTFWDYKRDRWPLDKGMRLDHFLLSPTVPLGHRGPRWKSRSRSNRPSSRLGETVPRWMVRRSRNYQWEIVQVRVSLGKRMGRWDDGKSRLACCEDIREEIANP
jgi:exodeoxyribonuclease-3